MGASSGGAAEFGVGKQIETHVLMSFDLLGEIMLPGFLMIDRALEGVAVAAELFDREFGARGSLSSGSISRSRHSFRFHAGNKGRWRSRRDHR